MKKVISILLSLIIVSSFSFAGSKVRVKVDGKNKMLERLETREYDAKGKLLKLTDKDGNTIEYKYDENGNCTFDGSIYTTYDELGREIKSGNNWNGYIYWQYYKDTDYFTYRGTVDPNSNYSYGEKSYWTYDDNGVVQTYTYDDGWNNYKITYIYNDKNQLIEKKYEGKEKNGSVYFADYDENGNAAYIEDEFNLSGGTKLFEYDDNSNITYMWYDDNEYYYEYDDHNNKILTKNADEDIIEKYNYEYDENGKIVFYEKKSYDYYGDERVVIKYEYDDNGNILCDYNYDKSINDTYEYDDNNRLIKMTSESDYYTYVYYYEYKFNDDGSVQYRYKYLLDTYYNY